MEFKKYDYIAERKRNFIFYYLEKFLSKFFPSLFVYELIFIFEKIITSNFLFFLKIDIL